MKPLPDFRSATYTLSSENPFRLTSPRSQATFRIPQQSTTGETSESSNNIPPDITFEEALASFKTLYAQKKYQGFALTRTENSIVARMQHFEWKVSCTPNTQINNITAS